ncbi:electron transfer flavoprotein subunit alpha/FixB family protein [Sporomusa sp.]|uniref:electron transfer flavoprotein subunit alpha/FixB family protein n=1 Tax=Sporomusa sp. TaxID=2078658 RepID=UPI002BDECD4B|nr:electron transfer flavoprotein subunit alpha/FixB family protein [Sporomusa sp.]HWR42310.1 electron transfer flavoprotein subunit alpha/FixB family protein [Sporomusa sp.]
MPGIWIYSEDSAIARQLLTAGLDLKKTMNQPIVVLTLSAEDSQALISAGADKVCIVKGTNPWPESYANAVAELLDKEAVNVLLVGGTMRGKDFAAKVAASLKAGLVTDALSVAYAGDAIETTRLVYGGVAVRTEAVALPALVTIPPRTFAEAADQGAGPGEVVSVEVANDDERVSVTNVCPIVRQGADIAAADRVVCVGRGLNKKEDLALVEALAAAVGAEIGCTRGISEDYHWLPNERYIGISGQKVKPELYIGMGISGQVQHVVGVRDSKIIVAIDTNEKAPFFEAADYGIVGDLYEVVPLLTKAMQK